MAGIESEHGRQEEADMNASEWLTICQKVEAQWGPSRKWDRAGDLALDKKVSTLAVHWAEQAIDKIADSAERDNAPAPISILRLGHVLQETGRRLEQGLGSCRHRNWAFLDADTTADGKRHGTCVACGAERFFAPGKLLTATEQGSDQFPDLTPPEAIA